MGDRFYGQQLKKLGTCPGVKSTKQRKRRMAWDDEKKAQAVEMYLAGDPTPENSMEIVKDIAEELEESPNGVRMILTKAEVYVKKAPAASAAKSSGTSSTGGTRVSKASAQESLVAAIQEAGQPVDEGIVEKLTGKAALYFASVISGINKS